MTTVVISPTGIQGPAGNTILHGDGAPSNTVGVDGDYYVDLTDYPTSAVFYGPKAGTWPGSGITIGGGGGGVISVNSQTGVVTITAAGLGALLAASNLSDLPSAATARTNLDLGGAAVLGVGTSSGTVAAGNDSRIVGAAQTANNLADLASEATARTNLGLGTAAVANIGTSSGTVASGTDTRITGALQASNNLSDVASAPTARTNLGLGTAATQASSAFDASGAAATAQSNAEAFTTSSITALDLGGASQLNVGTSAGTVAAGNDTRIVGALQAANNLSDVANAGTARTNLGLGSFVATLNGATGATTAAYPLAAVAKQTANYTAAANQLVPVDTTAGAVTITLPAAPADRTVVAVKLVIQGGTNAVTVACAGSDVFNKASGGGTLTLTLLNQGTALQYAAAGAIWYVTGDDLPLGQLDARYLQLAGDITGGTTTAPQVTATHLASALPAAQGGTGAASLSAAGIVQTANNLSDLSSASTARTNLGLGGAATENVGTGAGTVAAGNDTRITGALQSSNNLSDLGSSSTARTNLGLGAGATAGAATAGAEGIIQLAGDISGSASVPTVVSTHLASALPTAQGGTGAASLSAAGILQASNNLSDVTTAATARTNLGLGTGATAGAATTLAQGIVQLTGDLGGTGASPSVLKVNGVTVNGTPTSNQVIQASNGTTAAWASLTPGGIGALAKSSNLNDVASASTARTNLGLTAVATASVGLVTDMTYPGLSGAGATGRWTDAGHTHPSADQTPADSGLLTWVVPPWALSSAGAGVSGTIYFMRVRLPAAATVTNIEVFQVNAGSTLTTNECFVGLYNSSGTQVGVSTDQSSAWVTGSNVEKIIPLTSTYSAAAGYYWIAMLFVGTTGPTWGKGPPSGLLNAGWHSSPYPVMTSTGNTSLPGSVTYSGLTTASSAFWAALS